MKIDGTFEERKSEIWSKIRAEHMAFNKDRYLWRKLLQRTKLPGSAFRVALYLIDDKAGNDEGSVYPSLETIARDIGVPYGTVRTAVQALRDAGLLHTKVVGENESMRYFFTSRRHEEATARNPTGASARNPAVTPVGNPAPNMTIEHEQLNMNNISGCVPPPEPAAPGLRLFDSSFQSESHTGATVSREGERQDFDLEKETEITIDIPIQPGPKKDWNRILQEAIRDADDSELADLSVDEALSLLWAHYGITMNHRVSMVTEWKKGEVDWIDLISEIERRKPRATV